MAYDVKKTDHLFVPFNRFGHALRDSKGNSKIYKDLKTLKQHNKKDDDKPVWLASDYYVDYMEYVPVVRCKDCKYWFKNNGHDKSNCPIVDPNIWMDDDGFCSYGERSTDA